MGHSEVVRGPLGAVWTMLYTLLGLGPISLGIPGLQGMGLDAQGNVVAGTAKSPWRAMHMGREGPVSLNPQGRKQVLTEHLLCAPWHWVADIF